MMIDSLWSLLVGKPSKKEEAKRRERLDQADRIWADCWAASAHEDELFDRYQALCRKKGKEFDFNMFFIYAGEHWRLEYDPYGYRKAFLAGNQHPYVSTLERLREPAEAKE